MGILCHVGLHNLGSRPSVLFISVNDHEKRQVLDSDDIKIF